MENQTYLVSVTIWYLVCANVFISLDEIIGCLKVLVPVFLIVETQTYLLVRANVLFCFDEITGQRVELLLAGSIKNSVYKTFLQASDLFYSHNRDWAKVTRITRLYQGFVTKIT